MSDRDFFREVDEAVRHERYRLLWDRYGITIVVIAFLVVGGVGAYQGWIYWRAQHADEAGSQFIQAMTELDGGDTAKATATFDSLVAQGPGGYRILSRLQLAEAQAKAGDKNKAVATFDGVASEAGVDGLLQGYATLQAAMLRVDTADYAEMQRRLSPLIESDSPWRFSARELLGLSAYRGNDMPDAEKQFSALFGDNSTPSNLRERADMMMALIVARPQSLSAKAK